MKPVELLNALHTLVQETDMEVIEQAQANVQKRVQNAIKHCEPTDLWAGLKRLLESLKSCKELIT